MNIEGEPFLKKVNGGREYYVSYVCNDCGEVLDEPVKISKHDKRAKEIKK